MHITFNSFPVKKSYVQNEKNFTSPRKWTPTSAHRMASTALTSAPRTAANAVFTRVVHGSSACWRTRAHDNMYEISSGFDEVVGLKDVFLRANIRKGKSRLEKPVYNAVEKGPYPAKRSWRLLSVAGEGHHGIGHRTFCKRAWHMCIFYYGNTKGNRRSLTRSHSRNVQIRGRSGYLNPVLAEGTIPRQRYAASCELLQPLARRIHGHGGYLPRIRRPQWSAMRWNLFLGKLHNTGIVQTSKHVPSVCVVIYTLEC